MKRWSLFALRVSTGWLLVLWGLDKLVNVEHAIRVAERFYLGVGSAAWFLNAFGVLEASAGVLIVLWAFRCEDTLSLDAKRAPGKDLG